MHVLHDWCVLFDLRYLQNCFVKVPSYPHSVIILGPTQMKGLGEWTALYFRLMCGQPEMEGREVYALWQGVIILLTANEFHSSTLKLQTLEKGVIITCKLFAVSRKVYFELIYGSYKLFCKNCRKRQAGLCVVAQQSTCGFRRIFDGLMYPWHISCNSNAAWFYFSHFKFLKHES